MRARIYYDGRMIGETDLDVRPEKEPSPASRITLVLFDEHTKPKQRPLFLGGPLEQG